MSTLYNFLEIEKYQHCSLGRIALLKGLIDTQELIDVLKIQNLNPTYKLGEILQEKQSLSGEQVKCLLEIQNRSITDSFISNPLLLGEAMFGSIAAINALETQIDTAKKTIDLEKEVLLDYLLEKGQITTDVVANIQNQIERLFGKCPRCLRLFRLYSIKLDEKLTCPCCWDTHLVLGNDLQIDTPLANMRREFTREEKNDLYNSVEFLFSYSALRFFEPVKDKIEKGTGSILDVFGDLTALFESEVVDSTKISQEEMAEVNNVTCDEEIVDFNVDLVALEEVEKQPTKPQQELKEYITLGKDLARTRVAFKNKIITRKDILDAFGEMVRLPRDKRRLIETLVQHGKISSRQLEKLKAIKAGKVPGVECELSSLENQAYQYLLDNYLISPYKIKRLMSIQLKLTFIGIRPNLFEVLVATRSISKDMLDAIMYRLNIDDEDISEITKQYSQIGKIRNFLEIERHQHLSFGRIALQKGLINTRQLMEVIKIQHRNPKYKLGEIFLREKHLDKYQVDFVLDVQQKARRDPLVPDTLLLGVLRFKNIKLMDELEKTIYKTNTSLQRDSVKISILESLAKNRQITPEDINSIHGKIKHKFGKCPHCKRDFMLFNVVEQRSLACPCCWDMDLIIGNEPQNNIVTVKMRDELTIEQKRSLYNSQEFLDIYGMLKCFQPLKGDTIILQAEANTENTILQVFNQLTVQYSREIINTIQTSTEEIKDIHSAKTEETIVDLEIDLVTEEEEIENIEAASEELAVAEEIETEDIPEPEQEFITLGQDMAQVRLSLKNKLVTREEVINTFCYLHKIDERNKKRMMQVFIKEKGLSQEQLTLIKKIKAAKVPKADGKLSSIENKVYYHLLKEQILSPVELEYIMDLKLKLTFIGVKPSLFEILSASKLIEADMLDVLAKEYKLRRRRNTYRIGKNPMIKQKE